MLTFPHPSIILSDLNHFGIQFYDAQLNTYLLTLNIFLGLDEYSTHHVFAFMIIGPGEFDPHPRFYGKQSFEKAQDSIVLWIVLPSNQQTLGFNEFDGLIDLLNAIIEGRTRLVRVLLRLDQTTQEN